MRYELELVKDVPNQQFFTENNGSKIGIRLHTYKGIVYASVYINDELKISGTKCVSGNNLLDNSLSQIVGCRIFFMTKNGVMPNSSMFGTLDCRLILEEIESDD